MTDNILKDINAFKDPKIKKKYLSVIKEEEADDISITILNYDECFSCSDSDSDSWSSIDTNTPTLKDKDIHKKKQQKLNLEIAQNYKDKNTSYYGKLYNSYCVIC